MIGISISPFKGYLVKGGGIPSPEPDEGFIFVYTEDGKQCFTYNNEALQVEDTYSNN